MVAELFEIAQIINYIHAHTRIHRHNEFIKCPLRLPWAEGINTQDQPGIEGDSMKGSIVT